MRNILRAGMIKGGFVAITAGSDSDMPHLETLNKKLSKLKIPSQIRICSAQMRPAAASRSSPTTTVDGADADCPLRGRH